MFCTECWHETDSSHRTCPRCGANLAINPHSYEEKLISALDHPLAEARVRACWLVGINNIQAAATKLMSVVENDTDLFVRRAAVQALGKIRARASRTFGSHFGQSAATGAWPSLYAATAPAVESGQFIGPSHVFELFGPPAVVRPNKQARNRTEAARLWEISEQLTDVHYRLPALV